MPVEWLAIAISGISLVVAIAGTYWSFRHTNKQFRAAYVPSISVTPVFEWAKDVEAAGLPGHNRLYVVIQNMSASVALTDLLVKASVHKTSTKEVKRRFRLRKPKRFRFGQASHARLLPQEEVKLLLINVEMNLVASSHIGREFSDVVRDLNRSDGRRGYYEAVSGPGLVGLEFDVSYTPTIADAKPVMSTTNETYWSPDSQSGDIRWSQVNPFVGRLRVANHAAL